MRAPSRFPLIRGLLAASVSVTLALACGPSEGDPGVPLRIPVLEDQTSGTDQLLQAVSVVDTSLVWVSGHGGTWARTTDGGATWTAALVPGAELRQFRDVHGASATTAWLLASGTGDLSRIFRTDDAGATWAQQWVNEEPLGFYDCMDFWDERRGFVYGDAVDGSLRILVTDDGGASWNLVAPASLPQAFPGEGGFAASGTCAIAGEDGRGWIAAALGESTRAFLTTDYGRSWSAAVVPVVSGDGAGLTSVSMVDARRGTAFGGNLGITDVRTDNLARTVDGGRTWTALPHASMTGALYGGVHVPDTGIRGMVAVGPGGADVSVDGGESWSTLDLRPWWGIGSGGPDATWITGPGGRIARIRML